MKVLEETLYLTRMSLNPLKKQADNKGLKPESSVKKLCARH